MRTMLFSGRVIGLLLFVLFLGAQLHFLSDLDAGLRGAHLCPVCSVLSFAVLLALPVLCSLPVVGLMEESRCLTLLSQEIFRSTSPRSPPAL